MPETSEHFLNINPGTVGRYALGGLAAGGSVAAAIGLLRAIEDIKARNKRKQEDDETNENTIVLRLPKRAYDQSQGNVMGLTDDTQADEPGGVKALDATQPAVKVNKESPVIKCLEAHKGQQRWENGQFGMGLRKKSSWQTLVAAYLAAGGGGVLGYKLIDNLIRKREEEKLQRELDASKTEYMDLLSKRGAVQPLDEMLSLVKTGQEEPPSPFHPMDYAMGYPILLALLGAGGSAYLTKRILDETSKLTEPEEKARKKRMRVKRIRFITEGEDGRKVAASDEESDMLLKTALGVFLDIGEGKERVLKHEKVATVLKDRDFTADDLYKEAGTAFENLMLRLQSDPELSKSVRSAAAETHPLLRYVPNFITNLSPVASRIDNKVYEGLYDALGPGAAERRAKYEHLMGLADKYPQLMKLSAHRGGHGGLAGLMLASTVGDAGAQMLLDKHEKTPEEKEKERSEDEQAVNETLQDLTLSAEDPEAAAFITQNSEAIHDLLVRMANRGKLTRRYDGE